MSDKNRAEQLIKALPVALERLLEELGLNNAEAVRVARTAGLGITEGTLSKWHSGKQAPSLPNLIRYLSALGKDLCDLQTQMARAMPLERAVPMEGASHGDAGPGDGAMGLLDGLIVSTATEEVDEFARRTDLDELRQEMAKLRALIERPR